MFEAIASWLCALPDKVTTQGLTAGTALASAILGPAVSLWIGKRQFRTTSRQIYAPIRQNSINSLRDLVAEIISEAASLYISSMKDKRPLQERSEDWTPEKQAATLKLTFLISQTGLMLDTGKESHISLIRSIERVRHTSFEGNRQLDSFPNSVEELKERCRIVLKQWEHEPLGGRS